jgi:hypothetical protein
LVEQTRYMAVARTMPAAAASVCEQHNSVRAPGYRQIPLQRNASRC